MDDAACLIEDHMMEEVEFDWTSCYPVPHISFILNQVAPQRYCTGSWVDEIREKAHALFDNQSTDEFKLLLCGRLAHGYLMPPFYNKQRPVQNIAPQYGLVAVVKDIQVKSSQTKGKTNSVLFIDDTNQPAGFTRVKFNSDHDHKILNEAACIIDEDTYLSSSAMQAIITKKFLSQEKISEDNSVNSPPMTKPQDILPYCNNQGQNIEEAACFSKDDTYIIKEAVLKETNTTASLKTQEKVYDDVCIGLTLKAWPEVASKWATRKRKSDWPNRELVETMCQQPCILVPGNHPHSTNKQLEWTYSFLLPEMTLFQHLNTIQKQCMVLFTVLRDQTMSFPQVVSNYHLKTVFMWVCERIPKDDWQFHTMGTYFIFMIDFLMECVINQNLPHYFMPEWNLFENLADDFQEGLLQVLADIRSNPLKIFFCFMSENTIPYLPQQMDIQTLCEKIEKDKANDNLSSVLQKHVFCTELICKELLKEGKFEDALTTIDLQRVSCLYKDVKKYDRPVDVLSTIATSMSDDITIDLFKHLYRTDRNPIYLANMASFYHMKMCATTDECARERLKEKTRRTFQKALSAKDATALSKLQYCEFLCTIEDYDTALSILETITDEPGLMSQCETSGEGIEYLLGPDKILSEELKALTPAKGQIFCIESFAFYTQVKLLYRLQRLDEAQKMLKKFWSACVRMTSKSTEKRLQHAWRYNLYGHTAKFMGLYEEAKKGFTRALQWDPTSLPQAKENLDICSAMILSLQSTEPDTSTHTKDERILVYNNCPSNRSNVRKQKIPRKGNMSSVNLPVGIKVIRNLHNMYVSLTNEKEKSDLIEAIESTYSSLRNEATLQGLIEIDMASFLIQAQKLQEAVEILDEFLTKTDRIQLTCFKKENHLTVVGQHLREAILKLDEGVQLVLPTLACAYYLKIQTLIQTQQMEEAGKYLGDFQSYCFDMNPAYKEKSCQLLEYAMSDIEAELQDFMPSHITPEMLSQISETEKQDKEKIPGQDPSRQTFLDLESSPNGQNRNTEHMKEPLKQESNDMWKQIRSLHMQSCYSTNTSERMDLKHRMEGIHKLAQLSDAYTAYRSTLEYANFLYSKRMYFAVIPLLSELLDEDFPNDFGIGTTVFSHEDLPLVDGTVQLLFKEYKATELQIPLIMYTCYIEGMCHAKVGKVNSARFDDILCMMTCYQEGCELVFGQKTCSVMCALTAHLAMEHRRYPEAITQFQKAFGYGPDNEYLNGWIDICTSRQGEKMKHV